MHGIMFGEKFLGPLQPSYRIQLSTGNDGRLVPHYLNTTTMERSNQDPRLSLIVDEWEEVPINGEPDHAIRRTDLHNKINGKIINSNASFYAEVLTARGMKLETFTLI